MDSFEFTKIVGAVCGSLLIMLLVKTGADAIVNPSHHGGGHGDEHHNAYVIEVADDASAVPEEAAPEVPFAEVYAAADASAGEGLFRACRACHKLEDGANGTGPYLLGVVGRDIGSAGGFTYSDALTGLGDVWSPENLSAFLEGPKAWAPGTKMVYNGMGDVEDRANLIAYLESLAN